MTHYLGLGGISGLDPNPARHILKYAQSHPKVGIALGDIGHDATAALVSDGRIAFAVEEERINRFKHFMGLPRLAVKACLEHAGAPLEAVELRYYLDPNDEEKARRVESCAPYVDREAVAHEFESVRVMMRQHLEEWPRLRPVNHHKAHAASAYFPSAFEHALVVVLDGQGESSSISVFEGRGGTLTMLAQYPVTASLGYLYSDVTGYLGFEPIEDEYKIMGLAAYGFGKPDEYKAFFDGLFKWQDDGGWVIPSLLQSPMKRLYEWSRVLGAPRRPDTPIEDRHIAIAYSLQMATERAMLRLLEHHQKKTGARHLCIAGGVGLNCSMNGVIDRTGMFDSLFVQPAAGDAGAALGAALLGYYEANPNGPRPRQEHVYFGPEYDAAAVKKAVEAFSDKVTARKFDDDASYVGAVAQAIADGHVIGWYQGRMEFGPRALGNRSILADPRRADMKDRVNQAVKKREEFRPFAPSTTSEGADQFFELRARDQYEFMTVAVKAKPARAAEIPAVVHVNGTARVHVVRREVNPRYHALITRLGELTNVPVVLNTSFNVKGEPIVNTPEDAIRCFLGTGIDRLALQGWLLEKKE